MGVMTGTILLPVPSWTRPAISTEQPPTEGALDPAIAGAVRFSNCHTPVLGGLKRFSTAFREAMTATFPLEAWRSIVSGTFTEPQPEEAPVAEGRFSR